MRRRSRRRRLKPRRCTPAEKRTWSCRIIDECRFPWRERPDAVDERAAGVRARPVRPDDFARLKALPVHASMLEVSELIYETCKTYLVTQSYPAARGSSARSWWSISGCCSSQAYRVGVILLFSLTASPAATASLRSASASTPSPTRAAFATSAASRSDPRDPAAGRLSIGMLLISVELLLMLCILLFIPSNLAGNCFIGFAIGESLAPAALRIAGGIFTKIADIGST
jgi:K(+)-stimulated pyrophosphate-energized sodium pump